jgi:hypothetical protein
MMVHSVFSFVVSRLPFVATVLTLVLFAASADLQPESALASPGESADLGDGACSLEDDNNGNHDSNGDRDDNDNGIENRSHDDNGKSESPGNNGGQGIFSTFCSVPGFASTVERAIGLLGT